MKKYVNKLLNLLKVAIDGVTSSFYVRASAVDILSSVLLDLSPGLPPATKSYIVLHFSYFYYRW